MTSLCASIVYTASLGTNEFGELFQAVAVEKESTPTAVLPILYR